VETSGKIEKDLMRKSFKQINICWTFYLQLFWKFYRSKLFPHFL